MTAFMLGLFGASVVNPYSLGALGEGRGFSVQHYACEMLPTSQAVYDKTGVKSWVMQMQERGEYGE
jgi:hypothetical protein